MFLAGVPVPDRLVLELARRVDDEDLKDRIRYALARDVKVLGLEIYEREALIRAMVDPPPGLEELRGVLPAEHVGRKRGGLA